MSGKISNPLSVIALFAGLAEAFATVAFINLPQEMQALFIYFVMGFPILLVVLFFATINWNHTVLYAPGDFEDQNMYLESMRIRESLKKELAATFLVENGGEAASPEKIVQMTDQLEKVVERAALSSRKDQILTRLAESPATNAELSADLHLNPSYAYRLLSELSEEGKIESLRKGRTVTWVLRGCRA